MSSRLNPATEAGHGANGGVNGDSAYRSDYFSGSSLSSHSIMGTVIHEGSLRKQSPRGIKPFQLRHFRLLTTGILEYYKAHGGSNGGGNGRGEQRISSLAAQQGRLSSGTVSNANTKGADGREKVIYIPSEHGNFTAMKLAGTIRVEDIEDVTVRKVKGNTVGMLGHKIAFASGRLSTNVSSTVKNAATSLKSPSSSAGNAGGGDTRNVARETNTVNGENNTSTTSSSPNNGRLRSSSNGSSNPNGSPSSGSGGSGVCFLEIIAHKGDSLKKYTLLVEGGFEEANKWMRLLSMEKLRMNMSGDSERGRGRSSSVRTVSLNIVVIPLVSPASSSLCSPSTSSIESMLSGQSSPRYVRPRSSSTTTTPAAQAYTGEMFHVTEVQSHLECDIVRRKVFASLHKCGYFVDQDADELEVIIKSSNTSVVEDVFLSDHGNEAFAQIEGVHQALARQSSVNCEVVHKNEARNRQRQFRKRREMLIDIRRLIGKVPCFRINNYYTVCPYESCGILDVARAIPNSSDSLADKLKMSGLPNIKASCTFESCDMNLTLPFMPHDKVTTFRDKLYQTYQVATDCTEPNTDFTLKLAKSSIYLDTTIENEVLMGDLMVAKTALEHKKPVILEFVKERNNATVPLASPDIKASSSPSVAHTTTAAAEKTEHRNEPPTLKEGMSALLQDTPPMNYLNFRDFGYIDQSDVHSFYRIRIQEIQGLLSFLEASKDWRPENLGGLSPTSCVCQVTASIYHGTKKASDYSSSGRLSTLGLKEIHDNKTPFRPVGNVVRCNDWLVLDCKVRNIPRGARVLISIVLSDPTLKNQWPVAWVNLLPFDEYGLMKGGMKQLTTWQSGRVGSRKIPLTCPVENIGARNNYYERVHRHQQQDRDPNNRKQRFDTIDENEQYQLQQRRMSHGESMYGDSMDGEQEKVDDLLHHHDQLAADAELITPVLYVEVEKFELPIYSGGVDIGARTAAAKASEQSTSSSSIDEDDEMEQGREAKLEKPTSSSNTSSTIDLSEIPETVHESLRLAIESDPLTRPSKEVNKNLWKYRSKLTHIPQALPKVLQALNWCNREQVFEMYGLLEAWAPPSPRASLELLGSNYPDPIIRSYAVSQLEHMEEEEISEVLLQLVQAVKVELYHDSKLVRFLLDSSLKDPAIGHQLFWQLKSELHCPDTWERFAVILQEYLLRCGKFRSELLKEADSVKKFETIAKRIKEGSNKEERMNILRTMFTETRLPQSFRIPLDLSIEVSGVQIPKCKFMDSKKLPLWLVLDNADQSGQAIYIIFKAGDDLRQDQLTLQMFRVMDNLWRKGGLDLKMRPYKCVTTGDEVGMLEVVLNSETTSKISMAAGGGWACFREEPLDDWLREKNPNEELYETARDNFIRSCAGYCVATCVLGIGDRHNDNIMVTKDGCLFHIDFGHFLGNFKSKYGFKRERAKFVLTPDFAYVMGGKDSPGFKRFESLCIEAFNILRKDASVFINLFALMLSSGIPELRTEEDISYLKDSFLLHMTDEEAGVEFVSWIQDCLKCKMTQINNAVHTFVHG